MWKEARHFSPPDNNGKTELQVHERNDRVIKYYKKLDAHVFREWKDGPEGNPILQPPDSGSSHEPSPQNVMMNIVYNH